MAQGVESNPKTAASRTAASLNCASALPLSHVVLPFIQQFGEQWATWHLRFYHEKMMWSCCLQAMTFRMCWSSSQLIVKQGWKEPLHIHIESNQLEWFGHYEDASYASTVCGFYLGIPQDEIIWVSWT
ncbi:hypothetical protein AMECASPLE_007816 [Ameca splendens]|uniref:Uncharacterized protein n=1 Tax=Ameca splendens TaxID=208324 RepID=A0ABV0Z9I9_9TELE